jgi:hypothetical protein
VVRVEIPDDTAEPVVTPLNTFQALSPVNSVLAPAFIDPDPHGATVAQTNTSVLYWVEGSTDVNQNACVRYSIFSGEAEGTSPVTLAGPYKPTACVAHYYYSGSYFPPDGTLNYLAHWAQVDGIRANIVTLPGPVRFNAIWAKSTEDQPAVWALPRADFDRKASDKQAQGYRLVDLSAFVLPGAGERFNAIWIKSTAYQKALCGFPSYDFRQRQGTLQAQGYRLKNFDAFVLP